jgi:flagellar motor switch protein FliN/FliY
VSDLNRSNDNVTPSGLARAAESSLDLWGGALASVIESMTASRPTLTFRPLAGETPPSENRRWWGQKLSVVPQPFLWVGAADESWSALGKLTLAALGVDDPSENDVQATCRDLFAQAASALAQKLAERIGAPVTGGDAVTGAEPGTGPSIAYSFTLHAGDGPLEGVARLDWGFAEKLQELDPSLRASESVESSTPAPAKPPDPPVRPPSETVRAAGKLRLRARVVLGRASLPLGEIFKLNVGSAIELDRTVNDDADILVGDHCIGRGQIVVVGGNYGIKIAAPK